jgi:hypothetical protein
VSSGSGVVVVAVVSVEDGVVVGVEPVGGGVVSVVVGVELVGGGVGSVVEQRAASAQGRSAAEPARDDRTTASRHRTNRAGRGALGTPRR